MKILHALLLGGVLWAGTVSATAAPDQKSLRSELKSIDEGCTALGKVAALVMLARQLDIQSDEFMVSLRNSSDYKSSDADTRDIMETLVPYYFQEAWQVVKAFPQERHKEVSVAFGKAAYDVCVNQMLGEDE